MNIFANLVLVFQELMSKRFHCHSCLHFHNKHDYLLTPLLCKVDGQFHRKCLLPQKRTFCVHHRVVPTLGLYNRCRQRYNNERRLDKMWVGTRHRNPFLDLGIHHRPNICLH